ncbi:hypothetical protein RBG61_08255 [Paludicola sp. MB14-C6]|uniref:hypothetical protein n=1 Tax=Paludihabitans sp. MB14-C6 TaxID=3070656 RepID=UPI0027DB17C6|nr:hypothetical protein [Paludicola sp. MB14-C6]WMJ21991.1 hypothetical protein RBG61_08255 [Paludicola sp. MB14-C6]
MNCFNSNFRSGMSELNILSTRHCNPQETKVLREIDEKGKDLPLGFAKDPDRTNEFVHLINHDCSNEELYMLMMVQQAKHIRIIKKCAVFFAFLGIISLIFYLLGILATL